MDSIKSQENKKAFAIGFVCTASYLANYYLRHILSVLTPGLLETGRFDTRQIGLLSAMYMFFYAVGQLLNGILGDILSPKKMASMGIALGGISCIIFPFLRADLLQIACFAVFGYSLSMVRGPLMKIISENTTPNKARTICTFFSFSSFAGPLVASILAMLFKWMFAFVAAGTLALAIGVLSYVALTIMERKQIITYKTSKGIHSVFSVFKIEKFLYYMVIVSVLEVCSASISFWIPTYLTSELCFTKSVANMIFSAISGARAFMPFIALIIFRVIKEKDILMMRTTFTISAVMVILLMLSNNKWLCVGLLLIALLAVSCSSAILWSIYIPGLGKTGKVSSVNGVLDCTGYMVAAVSNVLFASIMEDSGWNSVFMIWIGIEIVGILATVFVNKKSTS